MFGLATDKWGKRNTDANGVSGGLVTDMLQ